MKFSIELDFPLDPQILYLFLDFYTHLQLKFPVLSFPDGISQITI